METVIYFFSGTGNSLWVARGLARRLEGAELRPMPLLEGERRLFVEADNVGFVFPVHMWGLPRRVRSFLRNVDLPESTYLFGVAVNGGQVSGSLLELSRRLSSRGRRLGCGFSVVMPSNYLPWGEVEPAGRHEGLFSDALRKIECIADVVRSKEILSAEKGPLWDSLVLSRLVNPLASRMIPLLDRSFLADASCNGCGRCEKICPARNIELREGKPVWLHHCEQCFACIQWCPKDAIQFGKNTPGKPRYHKAEIDWTDIAAQRE